MRKSDGNTTKENSLKSTPYKFYNLRLGDDKTVIPVDSSERCNEEVFEDYLPTGIKLNSLINIPNSPNDCSVMEVGYDTEFVSIDKVVDKHGKRIHIKDSDSHFNYLVSTQYYIHLFEVGKSEEELERKINEINSTLNLSTSSDEVHFSDGIDKSRKLLKEYSDELNESLQPKVWSDVILHSPQYWDENFITEEDILKQRVSLGEFIHLILQDGVNKGMLKYIPNNIHLISHNNVSDIDKFRDIQKGSVDDEKRLLDFFSSIRKSYSHRGSQISCVVDRHIAPKRKVKVRIYDTINLVSAVKKSLDELSKSVDVKFPDQNLRKLKLPDGAIEDMLKYRKRDLSSFCEYGAYSDVSRTPVPI